MSRSIITSATTFVTVLFLYILGVESMRAFAMPLAVGIVAGAFSSVLLAGSLFYTLHKKDMRYDAARAQKAVKAADGQAVITDAAAVTAETKAKITANPNHKKKKDRQ